MNLQSFFTLMVVAVTTGGLGLAAPAQAENLQSRVSEFLDGYNRIYQPLYTVSAEADWKASTDVTDEHTGERIGANAVRASFEGNVYVIEKAREFLKHRQHLDPLVVRQLEAVLYTAASYPGTIPEVVKARVAAEARQSAILDGFEFCLDKEGDQCRKVITPNQIDEILMESTDLAERQRIWEVSKQTGPALKPGLIELRQLRNRVAREMGFSSFFDLQVSSYGMTVKEMRELAEMLNAELKPLYQQLHTWTKHQLAARYRQPVPRHIPAHWLGNRWSQEWPGIVEEVDLDPLFKNKTPEWIIRQAEKFYVSLGWPELPASFWEKSDLYELPQDSTRRKNTHASAWHINLMQDVRSLMSVRPDFRWFETTHHELGHIYYFLAYSNPEVPLMLREGANRAFHEAVGDLISIAARQIPYLKQVGILSPDATIDQTRWLLNEALDNAVVFIPWSAGVMTAWEHDLYEENLSTSEFNRRWWDYVRKYQGVEPPSPRSEEFCDAATKTHINDDPAQYYDYALAYAIKYQLHMHIAKNILKQDPHHCNYFGNQEVGRFLWNILKQGRTRDWREVIKEATGQEIGPRALLEYFQPLMQFLEKENSGREIGW
ncbi:MAG: M2 family metallopeptidase [Acidobacteria bacterium]|nr:M2 family metallopeptidase [Acidobacteriota bacterium]